MLKALDKVSIIILEEVFCRFNNQHNKIIITKTKVSIKNFEIIINGYKVSRFMFSINILFKIVSIKDELYVKKMSTLIVSLFFEQIAYFLNVICIKLLLYG